MGNVAQLAVACLSFDRAAAQTAWDEWRTLDEPRQRALLGFADRAGLTLHLWRLATTAGFSSRLANGAAYQERLRKNAARLERRKAETAELLALFAGAGLRAAVLKGFTLAPEFVPAARDRVQYDLDFLFSPPQAQTAFDLLQTRGYEPVPTRDRRPLDHLPALVRKTGWEWRGDFFDIELPAPIELHFRLWDPEFERIPLVIDPEPLARLVERDGVPALYWRDQLLYGALHAMRHLFRGNLRLSHLYELAYFLDIQAANSERWREWRDSLNVPLRRLCAVCFALAARVFRSGLSPELQAEMPLLPRQAGNWLEKYSGSVLEPERSSKVEVLLQLSFVAGGRDRWRVLQRRLLPLSLPDPVDGALLPKEALTPARRLRRAARQVRYVASRAAFHLRTLPGFLRAAAGWWRS